MFSSSIFLVSFLFCFVLLKSLLDLEFDLVKIIKQESNFIFLPRRLPSSVNENLFLKIRDLSMSVPYL